MRLKLIWAEAHEGAIGRGGQMPWHLPEDLAHFKRLTLGAPVVMGRRTWESLPHSIRPLPGRTNVVVSRDRDFFASGAVGATGLREALAHPAVAGSETTWIIGGGQLYRAAIPLAEELHITQIQLDVPDADAFAPDIHSGWILTESGMPQLSSDGIAYRFTRWTRAEGTR